MRLPLAFATCALLVGCARSDLTYIPDAGVEDASVDAPYDADSGSTPVKASKIDLVLVVDNSGDRPAVLALRRHQGPLELVVPNHPASDRLLPLQGARVLAPDARAAP